ncbi:MAG: hypothetical protein IM638_19520 [Bacteroidetes bacterium]|nr:hypothetical protein [Bacteroidota bacterium]
MLYFFSKKNTLTDYTAKIFVDKYTSSPLVMKHDVCEERRAVYQLILKNKGKHFQNLIIGSSRVMQFGAHTGFANALNTGVSGATFADLKYITRLIQENDITCDTVIFDFNPWYILDGTDERFRQFETSYRVKSALLDILTLDYSKDDLRSLRSSSITNYYPANSDEINTPGNFIRFPDGSIKQKVLDPTARKKRIDQFCKEMYQMKRFDAINKTVLKDYVLFIANSFGKSHKIITLTPFHPNLFSQNKNDKRVENIKQVNMQLNQLLSEMRNSNVSVMGCFVPDSPFWQLNETDFIDGFHISEKAILNFFGQNRP